MNSKMPLRFDGAGLQFDGTGSGSTELWLLYTVARQGKDISCKTLYRMKHVPYRCKRSTFNVVEFTQKPCYSLCTLMYESNVLETKFVKVNFTK